jgi:hypothetical protein
MRLFQRAGGGRRRNPGDAGYVAQRDGGLLAFNRDVLSPRSDAGAFGLRGGTGEIVESTGCQRYNNFADKASADRVTGNGEKP